MNTTYTDKLGLARQPTCPSSFLDLLAEECDSEDYTLCEALLLNQGLSTQALDLLLQKGLPTELQVLAAQHPSLSLTNKSKLLLSSKYARLALLDRRDLTSDIILPLCLDPDSQVRLKAQNRIQKDK